MNRALLRESWELAESLGEKIHWKKCGSVIVLANNEELEFAKNFIKSSAKLGATKEDVKLLNLKDWIWSSQT